MWRTGNSPQVDRIGTHRMQILTKSNEFIRVVQKICTKLCLVFIYANES